MKKLLLVSLCVLLFIAQGFAQNRTVTGTVTAKEDGGPIPGVSVRVKGTTIGVVTGADGKYTLSVPEASSKILTFSFISYVSVDRPIGSGVVNVALEQNSRQLGEVVVTGALGIQHAEKELGYSTAKLSNKEVTATNTVNVANGLTGKVAGLAVYSLNDGIDPSISIVLRGNRSLEGNNNALIVLDGVPLPGALLSSINPDDVDDIQILKGAGAAALYGSEASNGAILITTKRGSSDGQPQVTYSNSFQFKPVAYYPKLQNTFGPYGGESVSSGYVNPLTGESYYVPYENQLYGPAYGSSAALIGPAYNAKNGLVSVGAPSGSATGPINYASYTPQSVSPVHAFFNTGIVEQNNASYSQGDQKNSLYFSVADAHTLGSTPSDVNHRLALSLRGTKTYGIFSTDFSVAYTRNNISTYGNAYTANLFGFQSLYATLLQFPAFLNIKDFQDPNGTFSNPNDYYDAYAINPYWIINNSRTNTQRDVLFSSVNFKLTPTKWFDASYKISNNFGISQVHSYSQEVDFSPYAYNDPLSAGNVPSNFKATGKAPGSVFDAYEYGDGTESPNLNGYSRVEGDAYLNFHTTIAKDYKVSLLLGNTIWQEYTKGQFTGSNNLLIPNFYNVAYIGGFANVAEGEAQIRQIAFFGDVNLNYKGYINLEGTLRNDRDSRLSAAKRSFYYPSVKLAFVPTEAFEFLKNNKILSYAKIFGSVSQVGNIAIGPYEIYNINTSTPGFPFGSLGGLSAGTTNFSSSLQPEITNEKEIGADLGFFDSRLLISATYYNQHVKNQTVPISTTITTGYNTSVINVGETESSGEEFQITGDLLTQQKNKFGLRLGTNFSINESKVISLLGDQQSLSLGNSQYAVVGQPFPLFEGTDFVRDPQGHVVVDANTGYPSTAQGALRQYGRTTPKYNLGVTASLSYKLVSLSAVAEYRGGNVIFNGVGQTLNFSGASYVSASAGRQAFVFPNSVIQTSPGVFTANTNVNVKDGNYGFWQSSAYNTVAYPYVSSGAFWKLREVNLTFNLNQFVKNTKYVKGASLAFTGRNLFLLTPKSNPWTDPEFSNTDVGSVLRGVNSDAQTPGTRIFGADLKLNF